MITGLVCLISDQVMPNLLFIRQFKKVNSHFYFLTTQKMEEKQVTNHLISVLELPLDLCHKILIDADDGLLIYSQLKKISFPTEYRYLLNITGGNKLMSHLVFKFFIDFESTVYYAPIDSNHYQILHPQLDRVPKDDTIQVSLGDYLKAYGFTINEQLTYYEGKPRPQVIMRQLQKQHGQKKRLVIPRKFGDTIDGRTKKYESGEWFELYCYDYFKKCFDLTNNEICSGVKIKRTDSSEALPSSNEIDVMFVYNHTLYVIECKVYLNGSIKMDRISPDMYKLASVSSSFGLKCKKYLAVIGYWSDHHDFEENLENRMLSQGIEKILDLSDFSDRPSKDILNKKKPNKLADLMQKFNQ